eukprot:3573846-Pyramimonas_sp.AAC.1
MNARWPTVDSSWCPDAAPRSSSQGGHHAKATIDRDTQNLSAGLGAGVLVGGQADAVEGVARLILKSLHLLALAAQETRVVHVDIVEGAARQR